MSAPIINPPRTDSAVEGRMERAMVTIRNEMPADIDAREDLLDRVWGPSRFGKTAERLREGRIFRREHFFGAKPRDLGGRALRA